VFCVSIVRSRHNNIYCSREQFIPPVEARTTGSLFNFPATLFLVQSYGLYVDDARGAILVSTRPTCYVSFQYQLYGDMDEACARPPRVM